VAATSAKRRAAGGRLPAPSLVAAHRLPDHRQFNFQRRAEQREGCSRPFTQSPMTQSPTVAAIADALDELELYDDTDEARALVALLELTQDAERTLTV
jgi:hypothetical protein